MKPHNYWKDVENVNRELEKIMREHGFKGLPTQKILHSLGHSNLVSAISKHHGGFTENRKNIGEEVKKIKPNGYWKDIENVKRELAILMNEHGFKTLPSKNTLQTFLRCPKKRLSLPCGTSGRD